MLLESNIVRNSFVIASTSITSQTGLARLTTCLALDPSATLLPVAVPASDIDHTTIKRERGLHEAEGNYINGHA